MDFLAGVVSGLVMGTVFLGVGIYVVFANRDMYDRLSRSLPQGISPTVVMLGFVIGMPPLWSILGGIAGLLFWLVDNSFPNAGLGSSNLIFTVVILCLAALAILVMLIAGKRILRLGLIVSISFAGVFGWLMPLLANWR